MLDVSRITHIENNRTVLDQISLYQLPLEKIGIAGETGSGKSTLLRIAAGITTATIGEVHFMGERLLRMPEEKLIPGHAGIGWLSQHFEIPKHLSVAQILEYNTKVTEEEAAKIFEVCRITHLLDRRTDQLSGGERQRIALARLLAGRPKLLLLDEPFSNLDMVHKQELISVINDTYNVFKTGIILVSHEPRDLLGWADTLILMKDGKIVQKGTPEILYHFPNSIYTAGLLGQFMNWNEDTAAHFQLPVPAGQQLFIRPGYLEITQDPRDISVIVERCEFHGAWYTITAKLLDERITIYHPEPFTNGQQLFIRIRPTNRPLHYFPNLS